MAKQVRLTVYGRVDLDGTHRAIIETERSKFDPEGRDGAAPVIELIAAGASSGVMLQEFTESRENKIFVDRYKLRHLGLKDGDPVTAKEVFPTIAEEVTLAVPEDFAQGDLVRFIGKPLCTGEQTVLFSFSGDARVFQVESTTPDGVVQVGASTKIQEMKRKKDEVSVSWDDIGGLSREIRRIREVAEYPFRFPELFTHLGVAPPRGIILHGPPGTGKTLIAKALAGETGAKFYSISGPEVYSKWYGRSEETLRNIFEEAVKNAPAIVVIDELDALVPKREKTHGDQEQRIVATFLTQMDGLKQLGNVVVLGTTNRIDAIDSALRRGGRFECEIHIGAPSPEGREQILGIHTRGMPLAKGVDRASLAAKMGGYVGADIASVCREAAYNALRRNLPEDVFDSGSAVTTEGLDVNHLDFERAINTVPASGGRELFVEVPQVGWKEIGGLEEIKRVLVENIALPIQKREAFSKLGIRPARGVLLHGPPGTGKTLLARAVAGECGANFIAVSGSTLRSRWLGEAEDRIRLMFTKARNIAPSVIFFDEIDAAVPARGRDLSGGTDAVVNQILSEMDGIEDMTDVFVIGATNRIELLDEAVLRPGRFDCLIEIPLPDKEARRAIFDVHLLDRPVTGGVNAAGLAEATAGMSGAEIAEVCRDAIWTALRRADFEPDAIAISKGDLEAAVVKIRTTRMKDGKAQ